MKLPAGEGGRPESLEQKVKLLLIKQLVGESNNLEETSVIGVNPEDYIEYENRKEFYKWILTLEPRDVKNEEIKMRHTHTHTHKCIFCGIKIQCNAEKFSEEHRFKCYKDLEIEQAERNKREMEMERKRGIKAGRRKNGYFLI